MIGIFPVTYVEIIPGADPSVTPLGTLKSMFTSPSVYRPFGSDLR